MTQVRVFWEGPHCVVEVSANPYAKAEGYRGWGTRAAGAIARCTRGLRWGKVGLEM